MILSQISRAVSEIIDEENRDIPNALSLVTLVS